MHRIRNLDKSTNGIRDVSRALGLETSERDGWRLRGCFGCLELPCRFRLETANQLPRVLWGLTALSWQPHSLSPSSWKCLKPSLELISCTVEASAPAA